MTPNWISPFPDEVWELIFSFLSPACGDRNAVSLSCKSFYCIDRRSSHRLFIENCYTVIPSATMARFTEIRSVTLKGKPHFADFNLVPKEWSRGADTWVAAMAGAWPDVEEIMFKRMVVSDEVLEQIARSFKNLRVISLAAWEGLPKRWRSANCRTVLMNYGFL